MSILTKSVGKISMFNPKMREIMPKLPTSSTTRIFLSDLILHLNMLSLVLTFNPKVIVTSK